jgi:hypothetical protein
MSHTCALLATGGVRCWGSGVYGIGYADTVSRYTPPMIDVDVGGIVTKTAGGFPSKMRGSQGVTPSGFR